MTTPLDHETPKPDAYFGPYVVAFIDLLGQRSELAKLSALTQGQMSKDTVLPLVMNTAGKVRKIRNAFDSYIHAVAVTKNVGLLSPEQRVEYETWRNIPFVTWGFSDCYAIAAPILQKDQGPARGVFGVYTLLYGVAGMMLTAMAEHIPLRAGIEVGYAVDIYPGKEVYGPGSMNAYLLESQVALYPRAVIGDGLLKYLESFKVLQPENNNYRIALSTLELVHPLICEDPNDKRAMLDFLSPKILGMGEQFTKPAQLACDWAIDEFRRVKSANHDELVIRYTRLLEYFHDRGFEAAGEALSPVAPEISPKAFPAEPRVEPTDPAIEPMVGSTMWYASGPEPILDDLAAATLAVRIGMALNALVVQAQASMASVEGCQHQATRLSISIGSIVGTAAHLNEALRLVQNNLRRLREWASIVAAPAELGAQVALLCRGKHPASEVLARARNKVGLHWDHDLTQETIREFARNKKIVWLEMDASQRVYRFAADALMYTLVPEADTPDTKASEGALAKVFSDLLEARTLLVNFLTAAHYGFMRGAGVEQVEAPPSPPTSADSNESPHSGTTPTAEEEAAR